MWKIFFNYSWLWEGQSLKFGYKSLSYYSSSVIGFDRMDLLLIEIMGLNKIQLGGIDVLLFGFFTRTS